MVNRGWSLLSVDSRKEFRMYLGPKGNVGPIRGALQMVTSTSGLIAGQWSVGGDIGPISISYTRRYDVTNMGPASRDQQHILSVSRIGPISVGAVRNVTTGTEAINVSTDVGKLKTPGKWFSLSPLTMQYRYRLTE